MTASNDEVFAQENWWGTDSPTDDLFNYPDLVDYQNPCGGPVYGAGAPKIAIDMLAINKFKTARDMEKAGNWSGAITIYHEILDESPSERDIKRAIVKLVPACA